MMLFISPLLAGTESPWLRVVPLHDPLTAACTCDVTAGLLMFVAPACRFTHAAVFAPTADESLLLMKLTVAPQPSEVEPPKKHELRPTGKTHASGGVVAGWAAHAMAMAPLLRLLIPITRRKEVGTAVANRHWTALTRVPSSDGVKVLPFQIPRTMFPPGLLAVLRLRLMLPVRYGFSNA